MGRSNARGMSMTRLPSGTHRGLDSTLGQAARIFVLSLALALASQASVGPPSEQAKLGRATCFLNEIHHPQAGRIARATVFIAAVAPDGTLASEGTGFVVSDSADGGTQGSRIVTAAHVIEDIDTTRDGQRWAVFVTSMPAPVAPGGSGRRVGLAPTGKSPPCHGARGKRLFDHLVGTGEDRWRDDQAECLRGLEIDDELKGCRLLDRQIGRFGALQNSCSVNAGLARDSCVVDSIADQATDRGEHSRLI